MSNKVDFELILKDSESTAVFASLKAGQTLQAIGQEGDSSAWVCLTDDGLELGAIPQNIARRLERASDVTLTIRSLKKKPGSPTELASILVRAVLGKGGSAAGTFSALQQQSIYIATG